MGIEHLWRRYVGAAVLVAAVLMGATFSARLHAQPSPTAGGGLGRVTTPPTGAAEGAAAITAVIKGWVEHGGVRQEERDTVVSLYVVDRPEPFQPLWLDADGRVSGEAEHALEVLRTAADDGLNPGDYEVPLLASLQDGIVSTYPGERAPGRALLRTELAARFDVTLSAAFLRYVQHLHTGRLDPRAIGFRLNIPTDRHDFPALLRAAIPEGRVRALVDEYRPRLFEYDQLRRALARYRAMPAEAWTPLPRLDRRSIRSGDRYEGAPAVRRRLRATGDLTAEQTEVADATMYDTVLAAAVAQYQTRHGLAPDGRLGAATLASLNVPLGWRIRQLELALERQRWLPHVGMGRLVVVNIAMFRLWAWDQIPTTSPPAFATDVIVGRALDSETPIFASEIRDVVFQPYWNVPPSIVRQEILPALARNPEYLRREQMEIVRGQGDDARPVDESPEAIDEVRRGTLRIRQRPGPHNALGRLKFVFPNDENVYMHGTPAQSLFERSRRDFSHGCVRVEDPVAFAEWLFAGQADWGRARIVAAAEQGPQSQHVRLNRPARVVLFYATATVSPEDGSVRFADDIYGHDERLDRAMRPIAAAPVAGVGRQ